MAIIFPVMFVAENLPPWRYAVTPQVVPRHNRPPGPSIANFVAINGLPGPTMAAMDGPLCRKWSPINTICFCYKYQVQA